MIPNRLIRFTLFRGGIITNSASFLYVLPLTPYPLSRKRERGKPFTPPPNPRLGFIAGRPAQRSSPPLVFGSLRSLGTLAIIRSPSREGTMLFHNTPSGENSSPIFYFPSLNRQGMGEDIFKQIKKSLQGKVFPPWMGRVREGWSYNKCLYISSYTPSILLSISLFQNRKTL